MWWNYDRVKYILPFKQDSLPCALPKQALSNKFPWLFSIFVACTLVGVTAFAVTIFDFLPRNTIEDCKAQFKETNRTNAGMEFCNCIHTNGEPLEKCMDEYFSAPDDAFVAPK